MSRETEWAKFDRLTIDTDHGPLHVRTAGRGRPVVLLHGFPQTGHAFRYIAPVLSADYFVVVPDLPGYGKSPGPKSQESGAPYDKRSVARTIAAMMTGLGVGEFLLIGHDRGARVAYRLALDLPDRVAALISIDTVPIVSVWEAMDDRAAVHAFHWPLLAQPGPLVEAMLAATSDVFIGHLLDRWAHRPLATDAKDRYLAAYRTRSVQAGAAADYRAGAGFDLDADRADLAAGRKIACPLLVPYGRHYMSDDPTEAWRPFADDIRAIPFECGHFVAEEAPSPLLDAIRSFFRAV